MPNRRRRRLSTAIRAVAALAVTSPFAFVALSELTADTTPAPEQHEFVRAAVMTDLPGDLMSALSQGLAQFGVNLPPIPSLTGNSSLPSSSLTSPGLSPGLTSPGLTSPGLTTPGLTTPGLTSPALTTPGALPSATTPGLTDPGLTSPALTTPGAAVPGLTTPGLDPSALTSPVATAPGATGEVPIGAPVGLDPGADGTYPIYGDPSLGAVPSSGTSSGGGGLFNDLTSAVQQLGVSQVMDLIKGVVVPSIAQAAQGAAPGAAAPALPAPPPLPLPGA